MSKQEFILSFENQQKRRYKELSFEYRNRSVIDEYQFLYKRDDTSLDIKYFKDLVFLSKKATRSSLLCSYLPFEQKEKIELKDDFMCVKMRKPIRIYAINNITKYTPLFKLFLTSFMAYPTFKHYLSRLENLSLDRINDDFLNRLDLSCFLHKDFLLDRYQNFNLTNNNEFTLNVFDSMFLHRYDFLFITEGSLAAQYNNNINTFENYMASQENIYISLYENISGKNQYNTNMNLFNEAILGKDYDRILYRKFENVFGKANNLTIQYYSNYSLHENFNRTLNSFENNLITNYEYVLNSFKNDNAHRTYTGQTLINKFESLNTHDKRLYINNIYLSNKNILIYLRYFDTYKSFILNKKDSFYNDYSHFSAFDKINKKLYTNDYINFVQNTNKTLTDYNLLYETDKNTDVALSTYESYEFVPFNKNIKHIYVYNRNSFTTKSLKFLFDTVNIVFANKQYINIYDSKSNSINKYYKNLTSHNNSIFFKNVYRSLYTNEENLFINKYYKYVYETFNNGFINKTSYNVNLHNKIIYISKIKKSFKIILNMFFLEKISKKAYLNTNENVFIEKIIKDAYVTNNYIDIHKKFRNVYCKETLSSIYKISHLVNETFNMTFINKYYKNLLIDNQASFLFKEYKDVALNTDYIPDIFKEYFNISDQQSVISINKINKPTFTSNIINHISKCARKTQVPNTDSLIEKTIKSIFKQDDVLCDKLSHNVNFISLLDTMIIKKRIQISFFNTDTFVNKLPNGMLINSTSSINKIRHQILRDNYISIYRSTKQMYHDKESFAIKYIRAFRHNDDHIIRTNYKLNIFFQDWITTMRYAFIHQDAMALRNIQEMRISDSDNVDMYIYKQQNIANIFDQDFATIDKHIKLYEALNVLRTNNFPVSFYDQYFLSKNIILNTLPSLNEIHKIIKDTNMLANEEIDWAWTYEEDEGFDDPFKIDELLLPENDSRYEDFEDILFNRKTLKPRNPVQIIDDYTFIAKYPNHYPIKDKNEENAYKNVALEYLDVRTSIMRKVFIGYYKLWQEHIFEFSRMTIPQSAKLILDYLYTWILMSFTEEDIPEALRVFRQVRWYLERGIIECSEYYITYEPDDLTSGKLDNTNLEIPSDLFPPSEDIPQNNTMYINTKLHVIANNPNTLRQDAHITFYIDNNKETTISFSLHTLTPVYIILNEKLPNERILDTITLPTTGKMVYNIPYTGETNTFTIKKLKIDNNDNYFFIGNIVIAGMGSNGKLNIEFNPKIQGNKVLNHVSQKVIAYMNLYEDNEEIMHQLVEGNAHLDEVYGKLLTYWDLHWQNKDKGKRLTIKKT